MIGRIQLQGPEKERHKKLKAACIALAELIEGDCPECAEKEYSKKALEEVLLWANKAIARSKRLRSSGTNADHRQHPKEYDADEVEAAADRFRRNEESLL
jgi:hypothetical protein